MAQNPDFDPDELDVQVEGSQMDQGQLQQYAWSIIEGRVTGWFTNLRSNITGNKATGWRSKAEARELASKIEDAGNAEAAIEDAAIDVQSELLRVIMQYLQQHQQPDADPSALTEQIAEFLTSLHNPETQEVLLLAIKEEYRDDFRDIFSELGSNLWGLFEIINGDEGRERWYFMRTLATIQGLTLEEAVSQTPGLSVEEIPDDFRGQ